MADEGSNSTNVFNRGVQSLEVLARECPLLVTPGKARGTRLIPSAGELGL